MLKHVFISFVAFFFLLSACNTQEAQAESEKHVYIWSDCLSSTDEKLFNDFYESSGIRVHIDHKSTNNLIESIENCGYNCGADLVILSSLYDVKKLERRKRLHTIKNVPKGFRKVTSREKQWFGLGVDPYTYSGFNISSIQSLNAFIASTDTLKWHHQFTKSEELIPLYAWVHKDHKRGLALQYIDSLHVYFSDSTKLKLDTIQENEVLISKMSDLKKLENLDMNILKLRTQGIHYDMYTVGIVNQAKNFSHAKPLLQYLSKKSTREKMCNIWGIYSYEFLIDDGQKIQNPSVMTEYFTALDRILDRLEIKYQKEREERERKRRYWIWKNKNRANHKPDSVSVN